MIYIYNLVNFVIFLLLEIIIYDVLWTFFCLYSANPAAPAHSLTQIDSQGAPLPPRGGGQYEGNIAHKLPSIRVSTGGVFRTGVGTEKDPPSPRTEAPPKYSTLLKGVRIQC